MADISAKIKSKNVILRLFKYISQFKWNVALSIIGGLVFIATNLLSPIIYGAVFKALEKAYREGYVIANILSAAELAELRQYILILSLLFALNTIGSLASQKLLYTASNVMVLKVARLLRLEGVRSLTELKIEYIDEILHGDLLMCVTSDIERVVAGVTKAMSQLFVGVVTIVSITVLLFVYNVFIALVILILTPIIIVVSHYISKQAYKSYKKQVAVNASLFGYTKEMMQHQATVLLFNRQKEANAKYKDIDNKLYHVGWKAQYYAALTNPSVRFINAFIYAVVLVLSCTFYLISLQDKSSFWLIGGIAFDFASINVLSSYANQFAKPFNDITNIVTDMQNAVASANRIFTLYDMAQENLEGTVHMTEAKGDIQLYNVNFSYHPEKPLIKNLNLNIKAGSKIAIVGPTGCGKSTIINLLMRFYDINSGKITIDGVDISKIPLEEYRKLFGMVLQESFMFSMSIAENIAFGKPDATREEIKAAAKAAYCDFFIENLEQDYDTLYDSKITLSQGEKQLIAIARVMLKNSSILILDEATSNIDTMMDKRIQRAFKKLMENKTTFIVAHRLSTILDADQILVMDNGCIVEQGRHEELLAKQGFYANLYYSQFTH